MRVHDTEDPEPIVLNRLDWVAVQRQRLQVSETVKLFCLFQIGDEVAVEVQSFQLLKLQQVHLNRLQVVVREVQPEQVLRIPHHVEKHLGEANDCSQFVVLQKQRCRLILHNNLLLRLRLCLLHLATAQGTLLVGEGDVVVDKDLLNLSRLGRSDHSFLWLGRLRLFLRVFFVRLTPAILILQAAI